MRLGFGYGRPVIVIGGMRRFPVPSWAVRVLQVGLFAMACGIALIVGILAYALISIAFGGS